MGRHKDRRGKKAHQKLRTQKQERNMESRIDAQKVQGAGQKTYRNKRSTGRTGKAAAPDKAQVARAHHRNSRPRHSTRAYNEQHTGQETANNRLQEETGKVNHAGKAVHSPRAHSRQRQKDRRAFLPRKERGGRRHSFQPGISHCQRAPP